MSKQRALQLVEAAVWLEATGDLEGARKLYQQALTLDPENTRAQQAMEREPARPPAPPPAPKPEPEPARESPPPRAASKPPTPAPVKEPPKAAVKAPTPAPAKAPRKAAVKPPTPAPVKEPPKAAAKAPTPAPIREAMTPEPKLTPIQYQSVDDLLPHVDPELHEQATMVDVSLQHLWHPDLAPALTDATTLPEFPKPEESKPVRVQAPPRPELAPTPVPMPTPFPQRTPSGRKYLDVDWSKVRPQDLAMPPPPPGSVVSLELPPAPSSDPLTPPPSAPPPQIPPNMLRRRSGQQPVTPEPPGRPAATPSPRNAWEEDGTMPGVDLSAILSPATPRDAMDLLGDAPPRATPPPTVRKKPQNVQQEVESLIKGARDLLELDDHSGAMDLIEKAAELAPDNPLVQRLKENSEVVLQSMFESKLGRLDQRPRLLLRPDEIIWLNLDHRAGFVLAQIDGGVTYEDLFAICGMSRLDTLRILSQLVGAGVIAAAAA
ncbi:MAG TPA: hypothetical protein VIG99_18270 [Myxococcaceae bacterium]|jgi:hypothetical protein